MSDRACPLQLLSSVLEYIFQKECSLHRLLLPSSARLAIGVYGSGVASPVPAKLHPRDGLPPRPQWRCACANLLRLRGRRKASLTPNVPSGLSFHGRPAAMPTCSAEFCFSNSPSHWASSLSSTIVGGANGMTGSEAVVRAKPDSHTLLVDDGGNRRGDRRLSPAHSDRPALRYRVGCLPLREPGAGGGNVTAGLLLSAIATWRLLEGRTTVECDGFVGTRSSLEKTAQAGQRAGCSSVLISKSDGGRQT